MKEIHWRLALANLTSRTLLKIIAMTTMTTTPMTTKQREYSLWIEWSVSTDRLPSPGGMLLAMDQPGRMMFNGRPRKWTEFYWTWSKLMRELRQLKLARWPGVAVLESCRWREGLPDLFKDKGIRAAERGEYLNDQAVFFLDKFPSTTITVVWSALVREYTSEVTSRILQWHASLVHMYPYRVGTSGIDNLRVTKCAYVLPEYCQFPLRICFRFRVNCRDYAFPINDKRKLPLSNLCAGQLFFESRWSGGDRKRLVDIQPERVLPLTDVFCWAENSFGEFLRRIDRIVSLGRWIHPCFKIYGENWQGHEYPFGALLQLISVFESQ